MSKFKVWVREHQNTIIGCAIGAVGGAVAAYVGYKIGAHVSYKKGLETGLKSFPLWALINSGAVEMDELVKATKPADFVVKVCDWVDGNPDLIYDGGLYDEVVKSSGDLSKTCLVAVSLVKDAH